MKIRQISYFENFKCLEGKCGETCCMGWLIPLDDDDIARYKAEKSVLLKTRLLLAMSEHSVPVFNSSCGECTFHGKNGLCSLQLARGHEYIPETCRSYPRYYRNYGDFEERYLDLSCLEASRNLVRHADELMITETEGPEDCEKTMTNDDSTFLNTLVSIRASFTDALQKVRTYDELISVLYAIDSYSADLQNAYLHGDESYYDMHPFGVELSGGPDSSGGPVHLNNARHIFPLSAGEVDSLAHTSLYHNRLKKTNPRLYELFQLYFRKYYRDVASENGWKRACRELTEEYPETVKYLRAYYSYYLYQYWLKTYEDYSFLRNARLGIIHTSMLLLMTVMYVKKHRSLSPEEFAHVCTVYNRRAFFSEDLINDMYRVLDQRCEGAFTPTV
ncbi:MAG: flagellin lysine-N-methylase [Lachnospiraceae bacterium]|nr:flagellin lysine-N-methylase [Lachnospiraceae bacterium]